MDLLNDGSSLQVCSGELLASGCTLVLARVLPHGWGGQHLTGESCLRGKSKKIKNIRKV